jgi:hypothetical protein
MALQHLRSSTANKRPNPTAMAAGQVALNTATTSPGVFFKDANDNLIKVGPVHVGTTAPNVTPASGGQAGNSVGEQWLDTSGTNPVLKIWDGSAWQSEAGEFVNASGDTMTGALVMANQQQVRFREASANGTNFIALQASAAVASDKTITLPDVTGTVVTTGDTGTVTSTMLLDGTIVNADINASAAIADTKLATISTAGKVSNSATTATNANTASAIVARDASGNFSAGTITASLTGNVTGNLTGTASAIADNTVTSDKIVDGAIVNADINASAAIAGTKINPDFGSQNLATLGGLALGAVSTGVLFNASLSNSTASNTIAQIKNTYNNFDANPTIAYPVLRLERGGKVNSTFGSTADFGIARYENVGSNARTLLQLGLGHSAIGTPDVVVARFFSNGNTQLVKPGTFDNPVLTLVSGGSGDASTVDPYITFGASNFESANTTKIMTTGSFNTRALVFHTGADFSGTEKLRLTHNGYLRMATSGIQFNGDTADANSLDDYEEGTFTIIIYRFDGTNYTDIRVASRNQQGRYSKIGRTVNVWARLQQDYVYLSSFSTQQVRINLPFTHTTTSFFDTSRPCPIGRSHGEHRGTHEKIITGLPGTAFAYLTESTGGLTTINEWSNGGGGSTTSYRFTYESI